MLFNTAIKKIQESLSSIPVLDGQIELYTARGNYSDTNASECYVEDFHRAGPMLADTLMDMCENTTYENARKLFLNFIKKSNITNYRVYKGVVHMGGYSTKQTLPTQQVFDKITQAFKQFEGVKGTWSILDDYNFCYINFIIDTEYYLKQMYNATPLSDLIDM